MTGWLQRLWRAPDAQEAQTLTDLASDVGADPISSCQRGQRIRVCGTVRSLALRPESTSPTLEVEIYDGSGHLTLVWMGRRVIPGIEVGRRLIAEGRLTCPDGQPRVYNPEYTLHPRVAS